MITRHLLLFFLSAAAVLPLWAQQIDEGTYNEWYYSPNAIHGLRQLDHPRERSFYQIRRIDPQTVQVQHINPSGIVTNTSTLRYDNGVLREIKDANQWGEIYEYRQFTPRESNQFMVIEKNRGVNNFLPCKYAIYFYQDQLLAEVRYYSYADSLQENKNGYAIIRYRRYNDKARFGTVKEISYFDANDLPVRSKQTDFHRIVNEYDEQDNRISETWFGIHNEPIAIRGGQQYSVHYTYNGDNQETQMEYHDLDGRIVENITGVAIVENQWTNGYMTKTIRFDPQHKIIRSHEIGDSIAILKFTYDSNGNKIEEAYYDEGEIPIPSHGGMHKVRYRYSAANMLLQTSYYDQYQNPVLDRDEIQNRHYTRDSIGRLSSEAGFDSYGLPMKDFSNHVYLLKFRYDEWGRRISTSYWKDVSTSMPRWSGAFEERLQYDGDGRITEVRHYDSLGQPYQAYDGTSVEQFVYAPDGRLDQRRFLDHDTLVRKTRGVSIGFSIIHYEYDRFGRVLNLGFFDSQDQPVDALISFDRRFQAQHVHFIYKGSRIIQQLYYTASDPANPARVVDCLKSDYIAGSGVSVGRHNVD